MKRMNPNQRNDSRLKAKEQAPQAVGDVSPYTDRDDLDDASAQVALQEALVLLSDKKLGARLPACDTILRHLSRYLPWCTTPDSETVIKYAEKTLANPKASDTERIAALRLGTLLLICDGDTVPAMYSEWAIAMFTYARDNFARCSSTDDEAIESNIEANALIFDALSLMCACDGNILIGEGETSIPRAVLEDPNFSFSAPEIVRASAKAFGELAMFLVLHSQPSDAPFVRGIAEILLENDNYEIVTIAVESMGILNERHPKIVRDECIGRIQRIAAHSPTSRGPPDSRRSLHSVMRQVLHTLEGGSPPQCSLQLRGDEVQFSGFVQSRILTLLRQFIGDGIQHHVVQNKTVRRLLDIETDKDLSAHKEQLTREDKMRRAYSREIHDRQRDQDRMVKHLSNVGNFEDAEDE